LAAIDARSARVAAEEDKRLAQQQAAELLFGRGVAEAETGAVDKGLHTMLQALRQTPTNADTEAFRRLVRLNLAAWSEAAPVLRCTLPYGHARFVGPAGQQFVVWSGKTLFRGDTATGQLLDPAGVTFPDGIAAISEDGQRVITWQPQGDHYRFWVYDARTGALVGKPCDLLDDLAPNQSGDVKRAARLSPDHRFLAVWVHYDHVLSPWGWLYLAEVATGKRLGSPLPLVATTDSFRLVQARDRRTLLLLFRRTPGQKAAAEFRDVGADKALEGLPELAPDYSLQPDEQTLISVTESGAVSWWDRKGQPVREPWRPTPSSQMGGITADGTTLVVLGIDDRVRCYNLATGQPCKALIPVTPVEPKALSISPDGTAILVRGPTLGQTQLWHHGNLPQATLAGTATLLPRLAPPTSLGFNNVAYSPDRRRLLLGGLGYDPDPLSQRYGCLMETATNRPLGQPLRGGTSGVDHWVAESAASFTQGHTFSPDGKLVATCTHSGLDPDTYVRVWDAATGQPRKAMLRSTKLLHSLTFSPDSQRLFVGTVGAVLIWELAKGEVKTLSLTGPVHLLRCSSDGHYLAGARRNGWGGRPGVQFWDLQTCRAVAPMTEVPAVLTDMMVLPDGRTLLTLDLSSGKVGHWNVSTGQRLTADTDLELPPNAHLSTLGPGGQRFAVSSRGNGIQQWDAATGQRIGPVMSHPSPVLFLRYSPDGATLAAAYADGLVRLWDSATSRPVGPAQAHRLKVLGMAFVPDSGKLLTTTLDGQTQTWTLPSAVPDDEALLDTWLGALTGVHVENNEILLLDPNDWQEKQLQFHAKWPAGERRPGPPGGLAAYHEACALDGKQMGNVPVQLWHLDQEIALQPDSWLPHARRASVHSSAGDLTAAAADYARAAALDAAQVHDWYRHRARIANRLGQPRVEKWYLDQLLSLEKDDWRLYADRAAAHRRLGHMEESDADLHEMMQRKPDGPFLVRLANEYGKSQGWRQALDLFRCAEKQKPLPLESYWPQGILFLHFADEANYRRVVRQGLPLLLKGGHWEAQDILEFGWLCALAPGALPESASLAKALERVREQLPANEAKTRARWAGMLGALYYRAGQYHQAARWLNEGLPLLNTQDAIRDYLVLAMTHQRMGNVAEAQSWLDKARHAQAAKGSSVWLALEEALLRRETETLLNAI
jgi:WD40 repeat protein/tetratricopeptide (TPR) repeat protein